MIKQTIRVIPVRNGVWCRLGNGKAGVLAKDKRTGVETLKEFYPGDYEIINVSQEDAKSVNMNINSQSVNTNTAHLTETNPDNNLKNSQETVKSEVN